MQMGIGMYVMDNIPCEKSMMYDASGQMYAKVEDSVT